MVTPDKVALQNAANLVRSSSSITVLTGAGISTDSEIPDYRGPNGVWTKNPAAEKASTLRHYVADPEVRKAAWQVRVRSPIWDAQPNRGHYAVIELEQQHKLNLLVTQNVDGLHMKAGSDPDRLVEIHGSVRNVVCLRCEYRAPMQVALERVRAGEPDPPCPECEGILKSSTISFGQSLVEEDLMRSQAAAESCDLLLAVGSTLSVGPVNRMVPIAKAAGARVVIANGQPTEMDHLADVVVSGSISHVLPIVVGAVARD